MIDPTNRYANAKQAEHTRADGTNIRHIVPPILPHPQDHLVARRHRVSDSDRADMIAARDYGQASAWWLIANANTAAHPDQLTEPPGVVRAIPMPNPAGGGGA